jgi:hypothetical protein
MNTKSSSYPGWLFSAAMAAVCSCLGLTSVTAADIVDEAKAQGKTPADFPADDYDYYRDMDMRPDGTADASGNSTLKPLDLTKDEIKGRNTWMMWCGGNETFWDYLSTHSYGFMDLLKLCDFGPGDQLNGKRWAPAGLSIEPGTKVPAQPDEYGLYIRQPEDPAARQPDPKVYGRSSGIVGLRLFLNPNFDAAARKNWDAGKYRKDETYYTNPKLVRPYRVGMSCVFCHVAPHPLSPPADPEAPKWANLSTTIGAQYLRVSAVVGNLLKKDNVVFHILDSQPPGTVDTSLVATDQINNANTMNALFELGGRLDRSGIYGHRTPEYAKEYQARYGYNDFELSSPESAAMPVLLYDLPDPYLNPRPVPRILMEGADSVGTWGALARVHLNIGLFSERWITLSNILIGFKDQKPFKLADMKKNSVNWQTTEINVDYLAKFFLKSTGPMRLKDAPEGKQLGQVKGEGVPWSPELAAGRKVFANRCIVCHSSKQPNGLNGAPLGPEKVPGAQLVDHMKDPGYNQWALAEVEKQDFWQENFLSSEVRVPVPVIKTNASRAMATNGLKGHMWEDFSSETYKNLPAVGTLTSWNPFTQQSFGWDAPGNGRGYYRPASLVGLWSTAPFLHNNTVGLFNNDPSVKGRLEAFDDGIRRLLTPGKTDEEAEAARYSWPKVATDQRVNRKEPINNATEQRFKEDHGLIWRTPMETHLHIPAADIRAALLGVTPGPIMWLLTHLWFLPALFLLFAALLLLKSHAHTWRRKFGILFVILFVVSGAAGLFIAGRWGDFDSGPIPAGTPVDLLANIKPSEAKKLGNIKELVSLLKEVKKASSDEERKKANARLATKFLSISNSPDLVMDNGHYFAKELTPQELEDLIDLLKTL